MTPEQALGLLAQVAEKYQGTLQDHQALQQALAVLQGVVHDKAKELPGLPEPDNGEDVESSSGE